MKYLLLVYLDETWEKRSLAERQELYWGQVRTTEELVARVSMHNVEKSRLVPEPALYTFSAVAELNPLKFGKPSNWSRICCTRGSKKSGSPMLRW